MREEIYQEFRSFRGMDDGPVKDILREFAEMAERIDSWLPDGDDQEGCLRLLLEARDAAVRGARTLLRPGVD